jgi:hypothetical protein
MSDGNAKSKKTYVIILWFASGFWVASGSNYLSVSVVGWVGYFSDVAENC